MGPVSLKISMKTRIEESRPKLGPSSVILSKSLKFCEPQFLLVEKKAVWTGCVFIYSNILSACNFPVTVIAPGIPTTEPPQGAYALSRWSRFSAFFVCLFKLTPSCFITLKTDWEEKVTLSQHELCLLILQSWGQPCLIKIQR